jgi:S1-C subfamily serine protease
VRISGLAWLLIGIGALFLSGLLLSTLRTQRQPNNQSTLQSAENYFGVRDFVNVSGGVTFSDVYPPDAPADKAGLIGGDIINSFDGKPVRNRDELLDLLQQTPVARTVEVTYVRDGETKKTKLTTISPEQFEQLVSNFEDRPAGHGQLGFEDTEAVHIEGTRISGVQLNKLSANGPAALAGIREGDIVIELDGVPIRNRGEFLTRVRRAMPSSTVNVVVMRSSQRLEIPVKIGKR